jgi:predicted RNA methylase
MSTLVTVQSILAEEMQRNHTWLQKARKVVDSHHLAFDFESVHPRETTSHDGKRAGEFAKKDHPDQVQPSQVHPDHEAFEKTLPAAHETFQNAQRAAYVWQGTTGKNPPWHAVLRDPATGQSVSSAMTSTKEKAVAQAKEWTGAVGPATKEETPVPVVEPKTKKEENLEKIRAMIALKGGKAAVGNVLKEIAAQGRRSEIKTLVETFARVSGLSVDDTLDELGATDKVRGMFAGKEEPKSDAAHEAALAKLHALPRFDTGFTPGDVVTTGARKKFIITTRKEYGGTATYDAMALSGTQIGSEASGGTDHFKMADDQSIVFSGQHAEDRKGRCAYRLDPNTPGWGERNRDDPNAFALKIALHKVVSTAPTERDDPVEHKVKRDASKEKSAQEWKEARKTRQKADKEKEEKLKAAKERRTQQAPQNAASLREGADRLQETADSELGRERQTNTHRRADMAAGSMEEARKKATIASTMRNVADSIEQGDSPLLAGCKNRAQVEQLESELQTGKHNQGRMVGARYEETKGREETEKDAMSAEFPWPQIRVSAREDAIKELQKTPEGRKLIPAFRKVSPSSYDQSGDKDRVLFSYDDADTFGKVASFLGTQGPYRMLDQWRDCSRLQSMGIGNSEQLQDALKEYLPLRGEKGREDPVKVMERKLIGTKIPGYFPTPKTLANRVVEEADIRPGMTVLEPSAGKGNIADAVRETHPDANLSALEWNYTLREILNAKGHKVVGDDFMEHNDHYDRVVMNPPFEDGKDVEHVQHAYELLNPGGRLVSIMGAHPFFANDKKSQAFRTWLDAHGGHEEKLPEGSFAGPEAERQTGTNTHMIVIDKPEEVRKGTLLLIYKGASPLPGAGSNVPPKGAHIPKARVHYREGKEPQVCGRCAFTTHDGGCSIVAGPIEVSDCCDLWKKHAPDAGDDVIKAHDVSSEPRDERGRWTEVGSATIEQARKAGIVGPLVEKELRMQQHPEHGPRATYADSTGKTQYRYTQDHAEKQATAKFDRLKHFSVVLPKIRRQVSKDLKLTDATPQRVAATVVGILEETGERVGGEQFAQKDKPTFGISSLRKRHLTINGDTAHISFTGKAGVHHEKDVTDPALVAALKHFSATPGDKLFQQRKKDGSLGPLDETDVRAYLKQYGVIPHQFRTWNATRVAAQYLHRVGDPGDSKGREKAIKDAVKATAEFIVDTPSTALHEYINPKVLDAYRKTGRVMA